EHHPTGPFQTIAAPFHLHGADVAVRGRAPELGEHSQEILAEAGYARAEIDRLTANGVVGADPPATIDRSDS
ncbi:MAG: CoA transferase, partial [Acidimicrobiia bacterium]|nr:CoA transferase [Acidimicrobiia bacterium]